VPVADLEENGFNFDLRNPNRPDDLAHRPPMELLADLVETEKEILSLLESLQLEIGGGA
jgi:type I restriction enzyme M protein